MYGGGPYAFFMDPRMPKYTLDEWKDIVSSWYKKYAGIKKWHDDMLKTVRINGGKIQSPTGRIYTFRKQRKRDGSTDYLDTQIKNYMCQGTAGDIVFMLMVYVDEWMKREGLKSVMWNQVHDSLEFDCPPEEVDVIVNGVLRIMRDTPRLAKQTYGIDWVVPMDGDAKVGNNWMEMKAW